MAGVNIKNFQKEQQIHNNRANIATIFILLAFFTLALHLFNLQILQHEKYDTFSKNNRIAILPIAPNRGLIYDRNGEILAENKPIHELEINLRKIKNLKKTIKKLNKIIPITANDEQKFYDLLKKNYNRTGIPIKSNLNDEEMAIFAVNNHHFPGVEIKARLTRFYKYKDDLVHALGYVGRINEKELESIDEENYADSQYIGKLGIEKYYEDALHGQVGKQEVEINAKGRITRVLHQQPPVPGDDLYLTLDIKLQKLAIELLGNRRGAIIAIDPKNGDVLTLVSKPGYDPNLFVGGIPSSEYKKLHDDIDKPLNNRAIRGLYPPGSTVKPIVAFDGLITNTISPKTTIYDPGYFMLEGNSHRYRDMHVHGSVDLRKAIVVSCDVYFYSLAKTLGIDNLEYIFKQFGFGSKTNIDMEEELPGLVPSKSWKRASKRAEWYPGETVITGIGQGYTLTTPLQLANAATLIANRGVLVTPHLLLQRKNPDFEFVRYQPQIADSVLVNYNRAWDFVISAMQGVIYDPGGTASMIRYPELYTIAGKSGTAQVFTVGQNEKYSDKVQERLRDHSLFIAFAPVEDPKIAIAIVIENGAKTIPNTKQVTRKLMDYYLLKSNAVIEKIKFNPATNTEAANQDSNGIDQNNINETEQEIKFNNELPNAANDNHFDSGPPADYEYNSRITEE